MMGESKLKEATERHNTSSLNLSSFFEITGPQKQTAPGGWGRPVVATRWSDGSMLGWRRCRHTVRFSVTWDHGQVCKSTTTTWVWESRQTTRAWGYDNSRGARGLGAPRWKRTTWHTVTSHNPCGTTAPTWPVPRIPATEHTCWTCPVWWWRFTIKHCAVWWWPNTFLVYFTLLKCRKSNVNVMTFQYNILCQERSFSFYDRELCCSIKRLLIKTTHFLSLQNAEIEWALSWFHSTQLISS